MTFKINSSYLILKDNLVLQKQVSWFGYLVRFIGSSLGLCESNLDSCARKTITALNECVPNEKNKTGKTVTYSGKEIEYIQAYKDSKLSACVYNILNQKLKNTTNQGAIEKLNLELCSEEVHMKYIEQTLPEEQVIGLFEKFKSNPVACYRLKQILSSFYRGNIAQKTWNTSAVKHLLEIEHNPLNCLALTNSSSLIDLSALNMPDLIKSLPDELLQNNLRILHNAARGGQKDLITWLVENKGFDLKAADSFGQTVFHYAAVGGQKDLITWLVNENGFDLTEADKDGQTVLHYAARFGHKDLITWLVNENGFDLTEANKHGNTVLHNAAQGGHKDLITWLVKENGFNLQYADKKGLTIFDYAFTEEIKDFIRNLSKELQSVIPVIRPSAPLLQPQPSAPPLQPQPSAPPFQHLTHALEDPQNS